MKQIFIAALVSTAIMLSPQLKAQIALQKMESVNFSQVVIQDNFWKPVMNIVSSVTIPVCIEQTEVKTPRIRNFEKVVAKKGEKHEGIYFDDSDVYKALEAIAYSLKNQPDANLEKKADEWIDKIAAAQQPDGYLNTYFTLSGLENRWTDMEKHEDYCAGHLIEAAVAYYNTTGKHKFLDVAIRLADHIDNTFRQKNVPWVSGHQEIELALVKLYHTTANIKYLDLADWYLQQRGHEHGKGVIWDKWKSPEYCQDKIPVKEQKDITGHAVRAMYLYTGAADVGTAKNDNGYMDAMKAVWEDVVYRNMYITGGIGSSGSNEGFTVDYDLPNETAYCETCASVGMVFWNQRMNILTGDAKYIDVLERSLYNGALDGLSLSGDHFFYGNPLSSIGNYSRSEWFGCACCPANIARLVESIGNYIYAKKNDAVYVNLFVGSSANITMLNKKVKIEQTTKYPWDGDVQIAITPEKQTKFGLYVRIPGWAKNQTVPGDTYVFTDNDTSTFSLSVNGMPESCKLVNGYAIIDRIWKKGDIVKLNLPMPVRRVMSIEKVKEDKNLVALQRGPLVYCFEHTDNGKQNMNIVLPDQVKMNAEFNPTLLNGVVVLKGNALVLSVSSDGLKVSTETKPVVAIPYYSWANRGEGPMKVWVPRKIEDVKIIP
ncbi:MAG: beta-L-arabinofuranosidase domain-containing protein [Bacteroidia bacterium]|jgi:uncharacterized protein